MELNAGETTRLVPMDLLKTVAVISLVAKMSISSVEERSVI